MKSAYEKKVCLIQVGYLQNRESFFPLAAGMLMAYAKSKKTIRSAYFFDDIIFRRENTDVLTEKTDAPAVAAFSCYLWNFEYNKVLAAKLKKKESGLFYHIRRASDNARIGSDVGSSIC